MGDPGARHPGRDQGRLLPDRLRALRPRGVPHLQDGLEDRQGDIGKKMEEPHSLKSNEMAELTFTPQQPLVVDTFKNCEGLSRIAFLDGNGVVMLGKIVKKTDKVEASKKK